jgi:hypothetical protein
MASAIAVFGDDILVPDYALAVLIGTLTEVGCEVNKQKTCYKTPFRESCGSEYFNHTDVAIIRNRRYDYDVSKKLISNPVLLDLQRKFFLCGLYNTAALLREWAILVSPTVTQVPRGIFRFLDSTGKLFSEGFSYEYPLGSVFSVLSVPDTRREALLGCLSAVPSGISRVQRELGSFDELCCAFGNEHSLSSGVRTRYNKDLQRTECRLPRVYQRTRDWSSQPSTCTGGSREERGSAKSNRFVPGEARSIDLETGYPRLLARLVGDDVDRIAIRTNLLVKMAWSELPWSLVSQLIPR